MNLNTIIKDSYLIPKAKKITSTLIIFTLAKIIKKINEGIKKAFYDFISKLKLIYLIYQTK